VRLHFPGTGVWEDYFYPVSDFVPGDRSCQAKPYVTLALKQITPGIHGFATWAPRCWRYHYLPDYRTQLHIPLHEWLQPNVALGAAVVRRFIRLLPPLEEGAARVNPSCHRDEACLGLHIRHSDKASGRRVLEVEEFLPYAAAFVQEGGAHIYVATDSTAVLAEIRSTWPPEIRDKVRTMGDDIVRSSNATAVFDMGSHDRTNREILTEIAALAACQFLIHGLSAVSDSVLWMNSDLYAASVNLEVPEHMNVGTFATLVQMAARGVNQSHWPGPEGSPPGTRRADWWQATEKRPHDSLRRQPTHQACQGMQGVLHIASVAPEATTAGSFFTDIVNQLLLAERSSLVPYIHLAPDTERIYDERIHGKEEGPSYSLAIDDQTSQGVFKGDFVLSADGENAKSFKSVGNGIWDSYLDPVSDFIPGDTSCIGKKLTTLTASEIQSLSLLPESVRAWHYDFIPEDSWPVETSAETDSFAEMRQRGSEVVRKYFHVAPYIRDRAKEVNPISMGETCLAVHLRHAATGKYREKRGVRQYISYMTAFLDAGGSWIYLSTDSSTSLDQVEKKIPERIKSHIRSQGSSVVRRSHKWPTDMIGDHHRVNAEALVDITAMSQCQMLLYTSATVPEAAIYMNPSLHKSSVNLEKKHLSNLTSPDAFGDLAQNIVSTRKASIAPQNKMLDATETAGVLAENISVITDEEGETHVLTERLSNATIVKFDTPRQCKSNALVYLAQKNHSSYKRDSYGKLIESIQLLRKNYLSINDHADNLDIFIFHTSDFDEDDLRELEEQFDDSMPGIVRLVDLTGSTYWRRPSHLEHDNPNSWNAYPLFSEGYRRMIHFFAIDIWQFFADYSKMTGCDYRYVMRLDEDSFIHSPINYDIFDLMKSKEYVYGFRMCSYEMHIIRNIWQVYGHKHRDFVPQRQIDYKMCGFYNNFFVADVQFFLSEPVQSFLQFVRGKGSMYRRRLGDLLVHSAAVYGFANPARIHRFLDFTYEHGTVDGTTGCLMWGGMQAGYTDANASNAVGDYYERRVLGRNCTVDANILLESDLSPTYSHVPEEHRGSVALHTITAGLAELPNKGILSG
jgi:alpha 1,2-mannosyltransferase